MIHRTEELHGDVELHADVCVIGSGPGGAVVAKELAERGLRVVVLESGPVLNSKNSTREGGTFLSRYVQEAGMRVMMGNAFVVTMQAEALGGTSEINSAIFKPIPDAILKEWIEDYQLKDMSVEGMRRHFKHLEKEIGARPTEMEAQGMKNLLVKRGFDKLGWDSHPLVRAVSGCKGSSDCMTSCPSGAKKTMSATYIPWASKAGADVYPLCRVRKILVEKKWRKKGKARGVVADLIDPKTRKPKGRLTVHARAVVCSAGVIWSPILLRRSGLKARWIGRNLCAHIGVAAFGLFDEEVNAWEGATQGWGSNALFQRGMVMESLSAMPAMLSARLPGVGHDFLKRLKNYKHTTVIAVKPRGTSKGIVREVGGNPLCLMYTRQADIDEAAFGLKACIDGLFAAGAKEVYPGCFGVPHVMTRPEESEKVLTRRFGAGDFEFMANHVFGTCRMGGNPKKSVVDSWCETHEVDDLFVCDSSVIPTGMINNPQGAIMSFSRRAAIQMAHRYNA